MGCGKSSVGKRLSELLCCRFMDLDEVIVERAGRSIPEIFAEDGEGKFRRMEKEALKDVLETDGRVLEIPKTPALVTLAARCKGPLDRLLIRSRPLAGGGMSSPSSSTPAFKLQQELPSKNNPTLVLALGWGCDAGGVRGNGAFRDSMHISAGFGGDAGREADGRGCRQTADRWS